MARQSKAEREALREGDQALARMFEYGKARDAASVPSSDPYVSRAQQAADHLLHVVRELRLDLTDPGLSNERHKVAREKLEELSALVIDTKPLTLLLHGLTAAALAESLAKRTMRTTSDSAAEERLERIALGHLHKLSPTHKKSPGPTVVAAVVRQWARRTRGSRDESKYQAVADLARQLEIAASADSVKQAWQRGGKKQWDASRRKLGNFTTG